MLKQITLITIGLAVSTAYANSDSTLVPFDPIPASGVAEIFNSLTDSSDYIMPITSGKTAYFTKIQTKMSHRDASVIVQPEQMTVSASDLTATATGGLLNWDISVPKTIVGASVNNDTLYVMGSTDSRLNFQQGLLRVTKSGTGWSEPSKIKVKGFKPTSWSYGMYMHPTGDVLLIYQKTVLPDNFELFVSLKEDSNTYGQPMKLATVNSQGNEITPYLSMDKKRLYFSSNGFNDATDSTQVENYDLFVSQVINQDFSELSTPERLPSHINNEKSYEAYVSEIDSNNLIFSSDRNGTGMRLFAAHITRGYVEPKPVIEPVIEEVLEEVEEIVQVVEVVEKTEEIKVLEEIIPEVIGAKPVKIVLSGKELNFATDQYNASPEAKAVIEKYFPYTEENNAQTTEIFIVGYSDSVGRATYNQSLSKKRAQTMKNILVDLGWSADKIKVIGRGEENPIADNNTEEGRAENRRVEFLKK